MNVSKCVIFPKKNNKINCGTEYFYSYVCENKKIHIATEPNISVSKRFLKY